MVWTSHHNLYIFINTWNLKIKSCKFQTGMKKSLIYRNNINMSLKWDLKKTVSLSRLRKKITSIYQQFWSSISICIDNDYFCNFPFYEHSCIQLKAVLKLCAMNSHSSIAKHFTSSCHEEGDFYIYPLAMLHRWENFIQRFEYRLSNHWMNGYS